MRYFIGLHSHTCDNVGQSTWAANTMDTLKLTRKELYNLVWTESGVKLSKQYGVSDVWIAKICKMYKIPRPYRGYWARLGSGQRLKRTPLPRGNDEEIIEININPNKKELPREISSSIKKVNKIVLAGTPPHPLIKKASDILTLRKHDDVGLIRTERDCLNIQVTRELLPRALRIMDTVLKMLIEIGAEIRISEKRTQVIINGVSLDIALREELFRKRLQAKDHNLKGYYRFGFNLFEDWLTPSGRLYLEIEDFGFYSSERKTWRDTETRSLEDRVKRFISGVIRNSEVKREYLEKRNK